MAKACMIEREKKRKKTVEKWCRKRQEVKYKIADASTEVQERMGLSRVLSAMPRDSAPCRRRNRCRITGRANGYYRRFGLARTVLREYAMAGCVPGLIKSSW